MGGPSLVSCPLIFIQYIHILSLCVCGNICVQIDEIYRTENINAEETYCYRWDFVPTNEEMDFVQKKFGGNFLVPHNFTRTVVAFESKGRNDSSNRNRYSYTEQPPARINSQTTEFCERLSIDDPMALLLGSSTDSSFDSSQV